MALDRLIDAGVKLFKSTTDTSRQKVKLGDGSYSGHIIDGDNPQAKAVLWHILVNDGTQVAREKGFAILGPGLDYLYANNPSLDGLDIWIAKPPNSPDFYVQRDDAVSSAQQFGLTPLGLQALNAAGQPSISQVSTLKATLSGTDLTITVGSDDEIYSYPHAITLAETQFTKGVIDALTIQSALTSGQHQALMVCLDQATNTLATLTTTAVTASADLPARSELQDASVFATFDLLNHPSYDPKIIAYLYCGQAQFDPVLDNIGPEVRTFFPPAGSYLALKNKWNGTAAPNPATDDSTQGYSVGSKWYDTTNNKIYECINPLAGAAVWKDETGGGGSGDVVGPASATNNDLVAFDGTTGKLIKDSGLSTTNVAKAVAALADKFILQTADVSNLPNAQAMGALATGIVKNTTITGVQSIAAAGTDYTSPTGTENLSNKTITASTVDSTPIGGSTPAAGSFTTLLTSGILTTQSGHVRKIRVVTAAGAVTVATTDDIVVVNKSSGAATAVNLPSGPTTGQAYVIHDGKGDAATNPITITPAAGNINGAATLVLHVAYSAAFVVYNGTQWDAWTATLPILTNHAIVIGGGTDNPTFLLPGSKGNVIASDGTDFQTLAIGNDGEIFRVDSAQTTGNKWNGSAPLSDLFLFGDGSDGNVTISAQTTLTRDMYYNNLTLQKNLITNGYRVFVKDTLTINHGSGQIWAFGASASGVTQGAASAAVTIGVGAQGGLGSAVGDAAGGNGGAGDAGGAGGTGGAAGVGGGGTSSVSGKTIKRLLVELVLGLAFLGGGGGGGAGGNGNVGVRNGGAGGNGGDLLVVFARTISRGSSAPAGGFNASGGAGGNANNTPAQTRAGGGGGGGGGGWIYIVYKYLTGSTATNLLNADGGAGGSGGNALTTGGNGGSSGDAGRITLINALTETYTESVGGAGSAGSAHTGATGGAGAGTNTFRVSL